MIVRWLLIVPLAFLAAIVIYLAVTPVGTKSSAQDASDRAAMDRARIDALEGVPDAAAPR